MRELISGERKNAAANPRVFALPYISTVSAVATGDAPSIWLPF
jgi:hypothetical protein